MDKEKIKNFIVSQRQNGVPDEQIYSFLQEKGAIPKPEVVTPPKPTVAEKILNFTGGKEIAQGLGQTIAEKGIVSTIFGTPSENNMSKQIEDTQKQQFDIQNNLINHIKEAKALGKDTSRLEGALKLLNDEINKTGQGAEGILNPNNLTNKEVIGDALQLGTTVLGAGQIPSIAKSATTATGLSAGMKAGAITGAKTGAVYGASSGVSDALKENKDTADIIKSGVGGALEGSASGAILGGIIGGVSGGIKESKINKQNKYLDAITPNTKDLTPTEYEDLLNRGKIKPKTSTSPARYILSDEEKSIARKYKDIFTSNDPVKNTENIIDEISKKDKEVGVFLKKNNGIFNTGELKNSLTKKLEGIDDLTIDEKRLLKLKKSTIDNFVKGLKKNDMETLWQSRKEFDKTIEKAFSGSPTLQNTIKKEFRNGIQDFISERTPEGVYKTSMKEMSQLFNLKDIVNTKAVKEKGLNAIQLWTKRNPTKTKVIGTIAGTGAITAIGSSLLKN